MNVSFAPLGKTAAAKPNETVLDVARRVGAPLGNSCGGVGVCMRCVVRVIAGADQLTPPTTMEARQKLEGDERLACQAVVTGDCEVTTGYWG